MKTENIIINNIPAMIYGESARDAYLFVHGKCGCKEEAEAFAQIVCPKGYAVLSVDLPKHGERKQSKAEFAPWGVIPELKAVLAYMRSKWQRLSLYAVSIGAWFTMQSAEPSLFENCLLVSPIVDMRILICNMMSMANVTEDELKEKKLITTDFGETLSLRYYDFAKSHPIDSWQAPTHVIYGERDNLTSQDTITTFVKRIGASLTVVADGEHWFHTEAQLCALNQWIAEVV